jgi:hypothetical protein
MQAKKFLAGIFAVLILVKIMALLTNPTKWMYLAGLVLAHQALVTWVYLGLLVITACLIFSSLNLIDIALVMLFTGLLTGLSLIPYSAQLMKLGTEMTTSGFGKAWLSLAIWGTLALAVLIRVFVKEKGRRP